MGKFFAGSENAGARPAGSGLKVAAILVIVVFFLCRPVPGRAWFTPQHADLTQAAFDLLPADIRQVFQPYLEDILWFSQAPDITIRDWPNHEWNQHRQPGDQTAAPARIAALAADFLADLRRQPPDLAAAAANIGLLSHYLADLNQPLHTDDYADDNAHTHLWYEIDVWQHREEFQPVHRGLEFRADIFQAAVAAARRANLFYQAIMDAYAGDGREADPFAHVRWLTWLNCRHAAQDIADVWATLWYQGRAAAPVLALETTQESYRPGDTIRLTVSALGGDRAGAAADLYLAAVPADGTVWFLDAAGNFSREMTPCRPAWPLAAASRETVLAVPLPACEAPAAVAVYALLTTPGADPALPGSWLSNLAAVHLRLEPLPDDLLAGISDEPCLLPSAAPGSAELVGLPLRRWDFIFLGDKVDNPATAADESLLNRLIPGDFRHVLLYLGRDRRGRPCALEFGFSAPTLRVVRLPELEPPYPPGFKLTQPVYVKDIQAYRHRWAGRLGEDDLERLRAAADRIFARLRADFEHGFPYQLEFQWSGSLSDHRVFLVDDGREHGAGCTDYLLSLLEDEAGVCLHGTRMTAAEVEAYFRTDPAVGGNLIPDSWNPLPFSVTVADILDLGFHPVDPPPHVFPCDGSQETGLPVPARLAASPQLHAIAPAPLPPVYYSWRQVLKDGDGEEMEPAGR